MFLIFVKHYVTMIIWLWEENWCFTEYLLCVDLAKCKDAESYKQIIYYSSKNKLPYFPAHYRDNVFETQILF